MSTGNFVYKLRKVYTDKLDRLQLDAVRGAYPHEEYLRMCGRFAGLEWALAELNDLAGSYNDADEGDADDELTQTYTS